MIEDGDRMQTQKWVQKQLRDSRKRDLKNDTLCLNEILGHMIYMSEVHPETFLSEVYGYSPDHIKILVGEGELEKRSASIRRYLRAVLLGEMELPVTFRHYTKDPELYLREATCRDFDAEYFGACEIVFSVDDLYRTRSWDEKHKNTIFRPLRGRRIHCKRTATQAPGWYRVVEVL